jgi:hypothetical protein
MLTAINGGAKVAIGSIEVFVNEQPARLTYYERSFIGAVAKGEGKVRTPRMLLGDLYAGRNEPELKIFDVVKCKIQRKLEKIHPDAPSVLRHVWGRGFVFGARRETPAPAPLEGLPRLGVRWVPNFKQAVVEGLRTGALRADQLFQHYHDLSQEELDEWIAAFAKHGHRGLHVTKTLNYAIS